jgi:hypothetical protein
LLPAFTSDRRPNTPLLGQFGPNLWSLSAQCQLFQQAEAFSEVRVVAYISIKLDCLPYHYLSFVRLLVGQLG